MTSWMIVLITLAVQVAPPKTPEGLPACTAGLAIEGALPQSSGETIRYFVDVDGLSVGTIDFKIEQRGNYQGKPVTEYRSLFKLDSLVAAFVGAEGRAAAIVPDGHTWPFMAMSRYRMDNNDYEENVELAANGASLSVKRIKNGKTENEARQFPGPVQDFVTGFYILRRWPIKSPGCTVVYGNQRAYTVWLTPQGKDSIKTPVGYRDVQRVGIRYGSDKGKKAVDATVWLGALPEQLPFRVEIAGENQLNAAIHLYDAGSKK